MWNLWYITFGLLTLFVVGLAIGVVLVIKERHYRKLAEDTENDIRESKVWEKIRELEKLKEKYKKIISILPPLLGGVLLYSAGFCLFVSY